MKINGLCVYSNEFDGTKLVSSTYSHKGISTDILNDNIYTDKKSVKDFERRNYQLLRSRLKSWEELIFRGRIG